MAAPRKPQDYKRRSKKEATSASEWKKNRIEPLEVPSGNVCLARVVGMQALLKEGIIPNTLMPEVQKMLNQKGNLDPSQVLKDIDISQETFLEMLNLIDAVTIFCVVKPKVHPTPKDDKGEAIPFDDREEIDGLWVDDVDEEDKNFIFQFAVGGTRDLEAFRKEQASQLATLPNVSDVAVSTK